jgi:multidrug resistance efflux pump
MIRFADMAEFSKGYQFFMTRPSKAIGSFIIIVVGIILATVAWSLIAKMDDVVKADALLRPSGTISIIKAFTGGEILEKNYEHDGYVKEGEYLLKIDVSADILELENSKKLMERIENNILLYNTLLETIRQGRNIATKENEETYIYSEAYIIENMRYKGQINDLQIKMERERLLPDTMVVKYRIEDMKRELEQTEMEYYIWQNNQKMKAIENIKLYMMNKEDLERRISVPYIRLRTKY